MIRLEPVWPAVGTASESSTQFSIRSAHVAFSSESALNLAEHTGASPDDVRRARQLLQENLGINAPIHWLRQEHTNHVIVIDKAMPLDIEAPVADGVVTALAGQACAVLTADCVPILLRDIRRGQIAAVHGGWRGLAADILREAISLFAEPETLQVSIGPCISQLHYEVGLDVAQYFRRDFNSILQPGRPNHWFLDLKMLARLQLINLGVPDAQIATSEICTFADASLPSYRRNKTPQRMASLIWLETTAPAGS